MKKPIVVLLGFLLTLPLSVQGAPAIKAPAKAAVQSAGSKPANVPQLPSRKSGTAQAPHANSKGTKSAKTKSSSIPVLVIDNYHPYAIDVWTKTPGGNYEYRGRVEEDGYGYFPVRRGYVSTYIECVGLPEEEYWTDTSYVKGDYTLEIDIDG